MTGEALVQRSWAGLLPVWRLHRVGEQTGAGAYAAENRIPWLANFSKFGVWKKLLLEPIISGCIATDKPFQPWSSESMKTKFGFSVSAAAKQDAMPATKTLRYAFLTLAVL